MNNSEHQQTPPEFFSAQVREARRFYLDLVPPPETRLVVVCGGRESCEPDFEIHRSTFPFYSIEFVARGQGTVILDGRKYALFPGTVFSYGPGVAQDITTDRDDPMVKYFVDFAGTSALHLMQEHGLAPGSQVRVFAAGEIERVLDDLIQDGISDSCYAPALCANLLEYVIVKVATAQMPCAANRTPAFATYRRCRAHISENCERLMSLGQIAKECHVDRAYVCRLFRRYDHQTPYQFLMRRKMSLAAEQLQNPATLVKQVASKLGFHDPFHFSRAFKKVFGMSPDSFRRLR